MTGKNNIPFFEGTEIAEIFNGVIECGRQIGQLFYPRSLKCEGTNRWIKPETIMAHGKTGQTKQSDKTIVKKHSDDMAVDKQVK